MMGRKARTPSCHPTERYHSNGVCHKCYQRAWYERNRERLRGEYARYRRDHATEIAAYKKAWSERNAEYVKANYRRWYAATRETRLAVMKAARDRDPAERVRRTREWRRAHPERFREQCKTNRAKRRALEHGHPDRAATAEEIVSASWALFGRCYYCGECAPGRIEADHIVPLASGGSPALHNLVPACRACNASKSDSDALEWLTTGRRANDARFEPARRRLRAA